MEIQMKILFTTALLAASLAAADATHAGVIFDSQALATCGFCVNETRNAQGNYGAVLRFSSDVIATDIGIYSSVDQAQDIEFVIFDSKFDGGSGAVLFSETKAYPITSAQYLYTGLIQFTFQAGHTYDVGILGNGRTLTGKWIAYSDLSQGPITEIANNANIDNFASPRTGGYAGVSPFLQIHAPDPGVPEPATWAMLVLGLGGLGVAMRRRSAQFAQRKLQNIVSIN